MQDRPYKRQQGSKASRATEFDVVDDLPLVLLVTSGELDALGCYLGDVLAEFLQEAPVDTAVEKNPLSPSSTLASLLGDGMMGQW